jgi:hypothetical protein
MPVSAPRYKKNKKEFLEIECNPARIETVRDMDEIRLTSSGLEWCDARCVIHVWRHNSEISY